MVINDRAKPFAGATASESSAEEVHLFDALVAQVGRAFIRVTVDDIDAEINSCLKCIGTELGLDCSTLAQIDPVTGLTSFTHAWAREPYRRVISRPLGAIGLPPWTVQRILAGQIVVMSSPDKLPKEAALDRENFHRYGPKSNVVVPIKVGGTVVGGLSFASLHRERSWPAHTVRGLEAVGEIFGLGLERKRSVAEKLRSGNKLIYTSRSNRVGELASSAVHELNEPLAAILSNAEAIDVMLASEQPDLDEIREAVADIIQDNNRASEITQRVWTLLERDEVSGSK